MTGLDVLLATTVVEAGQRLVVAGVIAVATTALSLRLLGTRRGWGTSLLAGALGWGVAGLLALNLARWDWGADGLILHTVAIGIPVTMAVAVALDLLARPGSLAIGELAGFVVAPGILRSVRTRLTVLRRYRELLRLAQKHGFGWSAGSRAQQSTESVGVRLRRVLEEAGGVYVKLGQIAATRIDLLPTDVCADLAPLQNRVAPELVERIRPALEAELGAAVEDVFAEFDWDPLAAASIGQTYRARLRSGDAVVVKIQRPDVAEIIERDLAALALLARVAQRRTELGHGIRVAELMEQFAVSLRGELDFGREADTMVEMTALVGAADGVRIPKVHRELSTRRLLVQERFEGCTVADSKDLDALGIDRTHLGEQLLRSTLDQVLRVGLFHADPHPGNVFAFADGTLGLIDFGAVGRLDSIQQSAVIDIMGGFVRGDVGLLRNGVERVADVAQPIPPDQVERVLARLLAENIGPSGHVEPTVMQDLIAMLAQFGIRLPADLILLSRAFITLDGTLRVLAPGISIVPAVTALLTSPTASPILDPAELVREELLSALPRLRRLPDQIDRVLTVTGRGDLRIRSVVDEDGPRILRTLVNRALLSAIGIGFLVVAAVLLASGEAGPTLATGTGMFEVFGYGGLLGGTVLLLRVVAAVARDGTT